MALICGPSASTRPMNQTTGAWFIYIQWEFVFGLLFNVVLAPWFQSAHQRLHPICCFSYSKGLLVTLACVYACDICEWPLLLYNVPSEYLLYYLTNIFLEWDKCCYFVHRFIRHVSYQIQFPLTTIVKYYSISEPLLFIVCKYNQLLAAEHYM